MLKSLLIQNFILIDRLQIDFTDGFSVITGETGAGKSIILGALGLVLGQRSDYKSIKAGVDKCVIEAEFDISKYNLEPFFQENDLEYDSQSCLLRRELYSSGKSRAFINDSPASLTAMKELGNHLIDIHSQHQNLLLSDSHFQLDVVDLMAKTEPLLTRYKTAYKEYLALKSRLANLEEQLLRSKEEEDYIRFQYDQLRDAKLEPEEQTVLEEELETLTHAEEIKTALYKVAGILNGEERGVVQLLKDGLGTMESIERYFPRAKEYAERLRSAYIDLNDLASEAEVLKEDVEFSPERMDWVNERLNTFYTLEQKHHVTSVAELIELRDKFGEQLRKIDLSDEAIDQAKKDLDAASKQLEACAAEITKQRKAAAQPVSRQLSAALAQLGMPNTRFQIEINAKAAPGPDGKDEVVFLFAANKNEPLKEASQTASGGEISRLMLCIKAMIAGSTALPSIIFDEIDTGVSGEIANRMGDIMQELGQEMQVIAITHLPQIAAKGKEHYFVYKEDTKERTFTRIRKLDASERVTEIATMLSGSVLTDAAIANAKDLLAFNKNQSTNKE